MGLKDKLTNYKRVMQIARKPSKNEFKKTVKISLASIGLIGAIGFVIYLGFVLTGL